jgi:putative CocE/NonD family hydrolase
VAVVNSVLGTAIGLPPPRSQVVRVRRNLEVATADGAVLRGDHYAPALDRAPTVLIRTPYGKSGPIGWIAQTAARQGFHVFVQCCRGTYESSGAFQPLRHERADGLATLAWLRRQPWYTGELCTFGPSYVGFTQWAIAADAGPDLKAMATVVTASQFRDSTYAGGAFSLDSVLTWAELLSAQRTPRWERRVELWKGQPKLNRALAHLPMIEADAVATGAEVAFVREWLRHDQPDDPYWAELGHQHRIGEITAPVLMVGGWYDIFLPWQLADYAALHAAGRRPALMIGPWHHGSAGLHLTALREAIRWFHAHTTRAGTPLAAPVRIHVGGGAGWRKSAAWPPPSQPMPWYLAGGGRLATEAPETVEPAAEFTFDPADPTPALGGPRLIGKLAGRRDNRALEARPDVLTYTSRPLVARLELIGPVTAHLSMTSDLDHFDVFVRLCDVDRRGRSWNLCDGLTRVTAPAGRPTVVTVDLWPVGHRFAPGHRIRVQVSGGAHPRFARNLGSGAALSQPDAAARAGRRAVQHDPGQPSLILLPQLIAQ